MLWPGGDSENVMNPERYASKRWSGPVGYTLGNVKLWVILALAFIALEFVDRAKRGFPAEGSPLAFLDALRTLTFFIGLLVNERFHLRDRLKLSRRNAILLFLALSWVSGMAFELTLVEEGTRNILLLKLDYFIAIQAAYLPLTIGGLLLIRHLHYTLQEAFFMGALTCLWEATLFGIPMMKAGLAVFVPFTVSYYMIAYSLIICWPLIIIDERSLWDTRQPGLSPFTKVALGIPLGIGNMLLYGGWGALVDKWFGN